MIIYIDSREAVGKKYNTLVEFYVNGQVVETGVLQLSEFCCVDLEDYLFETIELKFYAVDQETTAKYKVLDKCVLNEVPYVTNLLEYKDFKEYDPEIASTIDDAPVPREWIYAYSTQVTKLNDQHNELICVFNSKILDGISICEVRSQGVDVNYKRNIDPKDTFKAFKEWFPKWIKRALIILPISIIIFVLAALLICSFNWSPFSGKSQMALLSLSALIFLIIPNGANIYTLKDNLKTRKFLVSTEILDINTFDNKEK